MSAKTCGSLGVRHTCIQRLDFRGVRAGEQGLGGVRNQSWWWEVGDKCIPPASAHLSTCEPHTLNTQRSPAVPASPPRARAAPAHRDDPARKRPRLELDGVRVRLPYQLGGLHRGDAHPVQGDLADTVYTMGGEAFVCCIESPVQRPRAGGSPLLHIGRLLADLGRGRRGSDATESGTHRFAAGALPRRDCLAGGRRARVLIIVGGSSSPLFGRRRHLLDRSACPPNAVSARSKRPICTTTGSVGALCRLRYDYMILFFCMLSDP